MKTINIIIPYFGSFPKYFPLFLESCKYNPTINWTIITDNKHKYSYPDNVSIVRKDFESLKSEIQAKFDFKISLDSPHKLCEFKPAYGYCFPEYIDGFDYWGYGDLDLIYGNLRKYLTDEALEYDKIFTLGHFSLIKNETINNEMFMNEIDGKHLYIQAFSSPANFNFDEQFQDKPNINTIFEKKDKSVYKRRFMADIYTKSSDFRLDLGEGNPENKKNAFFLWNKGRLFRYTEENGKIDKDEYIYIHLQKRKMNVSVGDEATLYKIIPNSFDELEVPMPDIEQSFGKIQKKHFNMQYYRIRSKNLATKIRMRLEHSK